MGTCDKLLTVLLRRPSQSAIDWLYRVQLVYTDRPYMAADAVNPHSSRRNSIVSLRDAPHKINPSFPPFISSTPASRAHLRYSFVRFCLRANLEWIWLARWHVAGYTKPYREIVRPLKVLLLILHGMYCMNWHINKICQISCYFNASMVSILHITSQKCSTISYLLWGRTGYARNDVDNCLG